MMIRQQAFGKNLKMLKGGLHCHTTRSDGPATPEETMRLYCEKGYDFLAITDHEIYNYKNFAPELLMTIIPGMEISSNPIERWQATRPHRRWFHSVCLGPEREDGNGYEQDEVTDYTHAKNQEEYQVYLDEVHSRGNLTIYAHPEDSFTPPPLFENMKGHIAMEIWNSMCALESSWDKDAPYWDELLRRGQKWYGVAADDTHKLWHIGNGWVRVSAENNVNAIIEALKNGEFYSSCGPEIYDFYVKDNMAVLECSPAAKIRFNSNWPKLGIVEAKEEPLTRVEINLSHTFGSLEGELKYLRATVIDSENKMAWTNPIFFE